MKKLKLNLVVLGTGLASLNFIDKYLEKKDHRIDVISPNFNEINRQDKKYSNNFFYNKKYIPFSLLKKKTNISDYFKLNNFVVQGDVKPLGSLEFGGLSNYWGLQIDDCINKDIDILPISEKKKLKVLFHELLNKFRFYGKFASKDIFYENSFKISNHIENLLESKNKNFFFTKPILALFKKKNQRSSKRFSATEFYKHYLKKKKIKFHNLFVKKIFLKKNYSKLICFDGKKNIQINAKKVVIGCGTLVTTKLLAEALNIKKEIRIYEHSRYLVFFILKKRIVDFLKRNTSQLNMLLKHKGKLALADFRTGNEIILNTLKINFKFIKPIIKLMSFFKNYMLFSNVLLDSSFSNLYMKQKKTKFIIFEKKKKNIRLIIEQKKIFKKIYKILKKINFILPIYKLFFSKNGSSYHYFGTIPISNKKIKLSTNFNCQLKNFKNVYIIDGSVFNFKENKFPLGVIMANARRIAEKF